MPVTVYSASGPFSANADAGRTAVWPNGNAVPAGVRVAAPGGTVTDADIGTEVASSAVVVVDDVEQALSRVRADAVARHAAATDAPRRRRWFPNGRSREGATCVR